jgi:uncharacterized protein (TIGR02594 family)
MNIVFVNSRNHSLSRWIIMITLCFAFFQIVGALFSSSAEARYRMHSRQHVHSVGRTVHHVHRQSRFVAHRPARFAARRPHRFASRPLVPLVQRSAFSLPAADSVAGRPPSVGGGVLAEAMRHLGARNVTGTRGAWCADYASMVLRNTGRRPLANRMASSALAYAPRVSDPRPGDLVVVNTRHGYAQHVGFFAGWDRGGRVVMVSGNWGHRVSRASLSPRAVAAFVRV